MRRAPPLILMDELAHSNVAGSRHPKRWQDVEELLAAGIDVLSTVNVQHLESLNDVVGGITGVRVAETLPDTVFDRADEVVLVDIPADELLRRLKQGKVYQPLQAERASQHFFRKGNLIALRELALRRTADRVQDDVQAYRVEKSINPVWKTGAALLACVGPHAGGEHVIRSTARLASQLNAEWHALYVETPRLQRLPAGQRERILKTLKLAQDLGARTAIVPSADIAGAVVEYARSANISKVIVGRGRARCAGAPVAGAAGRAHGQPGARYRSDRGGLAASRCGAPARGAATMRKRRAGHRAIGATSWPPAPAWPRPSPRFPCNLIWTWPISPCCPC